MKRSVNHSPNRRRLHTISTPCKGGQCDSILTQTFHDERRGSREYRHTTSSCDRVPARSGRRCQAGSEARWKAHHPGESFVEGSSFSLDASPPRERPLHDSYGSRSAVSTLVASRSALAYVPDQRRPPLQCTTLGRLGGSGLRASRALCRWPLSLRLRLDVRQHRR